MPHFWLCYNFSMSIRQAVFFIVLTGFSIVPLTATVANAAPLDAIVQCTGASMAGGEKSCTLCDLLNLAKRVLNVGIYIAVFLTGIFMLRAFAIALTASGSAERYSQAKRSFSNIIIGIMITITGYLVIDTLMRALVNTSSGWSWDRIC